MYRFRWNDWNIDHISEHGISPFEAEYLVQNARRPYPQHRADGKWLVWGRTWSGAMLQVIYTFSPADVVFVIHARPLTEAEKHRFRRRKS